MQEVSCFLLTLLGLVTIKLQIIMQKKKITVELGNVAQKGRYEWETHVRYLPDEKKCKNIRCITIEKKMDL